MAPSDEKNLSIMKVKADATIGSQLKRAKTLMGKGKLGNRFEIRGIGGKAGSTAIIVGSNIGLITSLDVEPYTTPQGHRSLQVTATTDSQQQPSTHSDLQADSFWNVCVPKMDRGQNMRSSCRALDGKLSDLNVGQTIALRGAGQALHAMIVFYSYIRTDWPGCEIVSYQVKNNIIENKETGRKNKK